jgi:phenylalanyl-tRNA synthetase beta chain
MAIGIYGQGESFFTLKGMIEELFANLGVHDAEFVPESGYGVYHPGRCARIISSERELGIMGEVHPDVSEKYGIEARCYCAELMLGKLIELANIEKLYSQLPKYPQALRDIALVVDEDTAAGALKDIITAEGGAILEAVSLFDVYRGKQIGDGKKSLAFSLTYRAPDRTLTDDEVVAVHSRIVNVLKEKTDAVLRDI